MPPHAEAGRVEVEIRYDSEQFRLRVRDDGKGIDPKVLANQGREGHYGLRGMPERAALIGAKLAVWSEAGAGTEVGLRVPARIVYATSRRRSWRSHLLPIWFRALSAALFLALLAGAYRLRMRRVQHAFEMILEARVGERTRIARELHDTLLQSFHGLLLRFQTALHLCPIARHKRKSTSLVRLITRRKRSRKGAMPSRDYGPPPSKRTAS